MKTALEFLCFASVLITMVTTQANLFGPFLDAHNACQYHPSTRIIGNVMDMAAEGLPVDDVALGNHQQCIYLYLGIMNREGQVNAARLIDLLTDVLYDRPGVTGAVNNCTGRGHDGPTASERAAALFKCVSFNLPSLSTVTPKMEG